MSWGAVGEGGGYSEETLRAVGAKHKAQEEERERRWQARQFKHYTFTAAVGEERILVREYIRWDSKLNLALRQESKP
jgi:hypothetical protein